MNTSITFSQGECKTNVSDDSIAALVGKLATDAATSDALVVAQIIRWFTKQKSPLGSLLQYSIDVCADETIGEEFYKNDPSLLPFLSVCGTENEDAKFINYIRHHKDVFTCRRNGCTGTLFGECPIMECEECGKQHYVKIDGITEDVCKRCVANGLNTCNREESCAEEGPSRMMTIHMV